MPLPPLKEPPSRLNRLLGFGRGSVLSSSLLFFLIAANAAQTASLLLRPFSRTAFRRFNRWAANLWWGMCVVAGKKLYGIEVLLSGATVPYRENAIVVLNHQEMADIPVLFSFARKKGRLGDLKWFAKDIIKYVPGVGWGMLFLDCLFVRRNWTDDENKVRRVFGRIVQDRIPLWLVLFAEGTRIRPRKIVRSQEFARQQGLTETQHVMIPHTKGFVASVQSMRAHVDAIYDVTIGYMAGVPSLWQWIKGRVRCVHLHVRRYAIDDLPEESEALRHWLIERFEEKDALLEGYYQQGSFPATSPVESA